jgi:hypothetical protein
VKPKIQTRHIKVFTAPSDGCEFDNLRDAEAHEAKLNVIEFFAGSGVVSEEVAAKLADTILADPDGFRDVAGALWRRPRIKRMRKLQPPVLAQSAAAEVVPKRRGRPPGSKNKPRAEGNGGVHATT